MPFELPMFRIVGERAMTRFETDDGGGDDVGPGRKGPRGGLDVRDVTEAQFNAHVKKLRKRHVAKVVAAAKGDDET